MDGKKEEVKLESTQPMHVAPKEEETVKATPMVGVQMETETMEEDKTSVCYMEAVEKPETIPIAIHEKPVYQLELSRHELKQLEKEQKREEKEKQKRRKEQEKNEEKRRIEQEKQDMYNSIGCLGTRFDGCVDAKKYEKDEKIQLYIIQIRNYEKVYLKAKMPAKTKNPQRFLDKFFDMRQKLSAPLIEIERSMDDIEKYLEEKKGKEYDELKVYLKEEHKKIEMMKMNMVVLMDKVLSSYNTKTDVIPYGKNLYEVIMDGSFVACCKETDLEKGQSASGGLNTVIKTKDKISGKTVFLKHGQRKVQVGKSGGGAEFGKIAAERMTYGTMFAKDLSTGEHELTVDTSYRDVAVSMVDRLLGLNAVVKTTIAQGKDGQQCSLMEAAEGAEATLSMGYVGEEYKAATRLTQQMEAYSAVYKTGEKDKFDKKKADELRKSHAKQSVIDLTRDVTIESAMNMAALDIIVGHVDRHRGNYFIDKNGRIIGIDNDTSFRLSTTLVESSKAALPTEEEIEKEQKARPKMAATAAKRLRNRKINDLKSVSTNVAWLNEAAVMLCFDKAFPVVTKELRDKILGLSLEHLRGCLAGMVEQEAIEACIERTAKLKKYFEKLPEDKILDSISDMKKEDRVKYAMPPEFQNSTVDYFELNYVTPFLKRGVSVEFALSAETEAERRAAFVTEGSEAYYTGFVSRYYSDVKGADMSSVSLELAMLLLKKMEEEPAPDLLDMIEKGEMKTIVDAAMEKAGVKGKYKEIE